MQEPETILVRGKDYYPLLGIVVAAMLGVSLLCGAGVVGINDINNAVSIGTPSAGIVDFVISNMNTMIVETVQAFSLPVIYTNTGTLIPTATLVDLETSANFPFGTLIPSGQPSRPPLLTSTNTPLSTPTKTPLSTSTKTPLPTLTSTNTPLPTPTPTNTPLPTFTDTAIPSDTNTPIPTDTDTPIPPDTDTPIPTDTDTPIPPDTDTPIPPDTDTPTSAP